MSIYRYIIDVKNKINKLILKNIPNELNSKFEQMQYNQLLNNSVKY